MLCTFVFGVSCFLLLVSSGPIRELNISEETIVTMTLDKLDQGSPITTTQRITEDRSPERSALKEVEELTSSVIGTSAETIQVKKLEATTTERQKEAELEEENVGVEENAEAQQQKESDETFQKDDDGFSMDVREILEAAPMVPIACGCILFGGFLFFIVYRLRSSRKRLQYRQLHTQ